MTLHRKYQSLLREARRRQLPNLGSMQLCFRTLSLAAAIDRDCAARLAKHGLSEGRFVLLFLLDAANEGVAPNELADRAGVTRATVTGLLDGMQQQGLIERKPDAMDRRALRIHLTRQGKRMVTTVVAEHSMWIADVFGTLDAAERDQLSALLDKAALDQRGDDGDRAS